MRNSWLVLAYLALAVAALMFRYDLHSAAGNRVYVLDRWTGELSSLVHGVASPVRNTPAPTPELGGQQRSEE